MTAYLVPCGLSILSGVVDDRLVTGTRATPGVLRQWAVDLTSAGHSAGEISRGWQGLLPQVDSDIGFQNIDPRIAAETTLLGLRAAPGRQITTVLTEDTRIALLATDTANGLLAAMLVAAALTGGDQDRVTLTDTPEFLQENGRYRLLAGQVSVIRLTRLTERDGFAHAAFGTGQVMRALLDTDATQPIEVHLAGGLKAMLLHTLALAEILRSLAETGKVSAWYAFEPPDNGAAEPVPIGLRRFPTASLDEMRGELADVARRRVPLDPALKGVAWEHRHGTPELNEFGHGYVALLGAGSPDAEGSLG